MSNLKLKMLKLKVPIPPLFTTFEIKYIDWEALGGGPFGKIELYSPKYYLACTLGGIVACGVTHAAVTPLDLVCPYQGCMLIRLNVVVKLIQICIKAILRDSQRFIRLKD
jgi:hypothetical protein